MSCEEFRRWSEEVKIKVPHSLVSPTLIQRRQGRVGPSVARRQFLIGVHGCWVGPGGCWNAVSRHSKRMQPNPRVETVRNQNIVSPAIVPFHSPLFLLEHYPDELGIWSWATSAGAHTCSQACASRTAWMRAQDSACDLRRPPSWLPFLSCKESMRVDLILFRRPALTSSSTQCH